MRVRLCVRASNAKKFSSFFFLFSRFLCANEPWKRRSDLKFAIIFQLRRASTSSLTSFYDSSDTHLIKNRTNFWRFKPPKINASIRRFSKCVRKLPHRTHKKPFQTKTPYSHTSAAKLRVKFFLKNRKKKEQFTHSTSDPITYLNFVQGKICLQNEQKNIFQLHV